MGINAKVVVSSSLGIILLAYIASNKQKYTETLETGQGKLQGIVRESRHGRKYSVFYGVPYGEPPVGDLRFQPPVPARNWSDVRVADEYGIECLQMEFMMKSMIVGQEDCLRLNIFTPQDLSMSKLGALQLYPVIVFVHGGGFMCGSSKQFEGDYFMDEDIIVVTLNYRLGALGFLNTGDHVIRGNMGLKDQNLALRWVQENIKYYGGDSNRVTLYGESAGAASVHLHLMSDKSKGLFHKAISSSGSALSPWAFTPDPVNQFKRLGKQLNCDTASTSSFLQCLQKMDPAEIIKNHIAIRHAMVDPLEQYGPTTETIIDDETFFSETPHDIFRSKKFTPVPWLMGVNEGEGIVTIARIIVDKILSEKLQSISEWYKCLPRFLFLENLSEENAKKITKFYFGADDQNFNPVDRDNFGNLNRMFADRIFNIHLHQFAEMYQNQNRTNEIDIPLYLYYYTYTYSGSFSLYKLLTSAPAKRLLSFEAHAAYRYIKEFVMDFLGIPGIKLPAGHADELALIFNVGYIFPVKRTSRSYVLSSELIKTISNFAGSNRASLEFFGKPWNSVQPNSINLMGWDMPEVAGPIPSPFTERLQFWKSLNLYGEI